MAIKQYEVSFDIKDKQGHIGIHMKDYVSASTSWEAERIIKARYGEIYFFAAREIKATSSENTSYSSKENISSGYNSDNSNTAWIKLGIIGAILYGLWILLSNIINFGLISKYDFDLYLSNITHFNSGFKEKTTSISTIIDLSSPENYIGKKYKISKNKIVFYNGYKDTKTNRFTAVSLYDNGVKIYGYIKHARNIDPLKTINSDIVSKVKATISSRYKKDLESHIKLYQAKTKSEIEDYKNKNYEKITQLSNNKFTYFYNSKDADLVENIESKYYEDEIYEKEFFKLGNEYYKSLK